MSEANEGTKEAHVRKKWTYLKQHTKVSTARTAHISGMMTAAYTKALTSASAPAYACEKS